MFVKLPTPCSCRSGRQGHGDLQEEKASRDGQGCGTQGGRTWQVGSFKPVSPADGGSTQPVGSTTPVGPSQAPLSGSCPAVGAAAQPRPQLPCRRAAAAGGPSHALPRRQLRPPGAVAARLSIPVFLVASSICLCLLARQSHGSSIIISYGYLRGTFGRDCRCSARQQQDDRAPGMPAASIVGPVFLVVGLPGGDVLLVSDCRAESDNCDEDKIFPLRSSTSSQSGAGLETAVAWTAASQSSLMTN